jgi:oligoribonuclease NrnB/cAMP/cGMP phosphodiesterase (DHH superfamily)
MAKANDNNKGGKIEKPDIAILHIPCPDGAACGVLINDYFGEGKVKLVPYTHTLAAEKKQLDGIDFIGKKVWICDCCPEKEFADVAKQAASIQVIEHHPGIAAFAEANKGLKHVKWEVDTTDVVCASMMVWNRLYPNQFPPEWLILIQMGDTGKHSEMKDRRTYYRGLVHDISIANLAERRAPAKENFCIELGKQIVAEIEKTLEKSVSAAEIKLVQVQKIAFRVLHVSASGPEEIRDLTDLIISRAKDAWLQMFDFIAIRWKRTTPVQAEFSLRRMPDSKLDLGLIAKAYGCGGHPAAAGVQRPIDTLYLPDV